MCALLVCHLPWLHICDVFFFKQKTAYEMRISDWSSDVCSSDLTQRNAVVVACDVGRYGQHPAFESSNRAGVVTQAINSGMHVVDTFAHGLTGVGRFHPCDAIDRKSTRLNSSH